MRLNEISSEDKSFLTLRGIEFNFTNDYNNAVSAYSIIGKSTARHAMLKNDIELILLRIHPVLSYGFNANDVDIIDITDIYNKLLEIKNKL